MILSLHETIQQTKEWVADNKIILATGVFDILHVEHIRFLAKAKAIGGKLIVGIETDQRVARIKGPNRPINSQEVRLEQIDMLKPVDIAFLLPKEFSTKDHWVNFMATLKPDYYAVSSHSSYLENKQEICHNLGIELKIVHFHNPHVSSTQLLVHKQVTQEKD